jgi:hypothetical protein
MKIVEDAALDQRVQNLLDRIPQEVDKMIGQLKSSLINPMTRPQAKRGIWDRFKNTMSNLWWGRYNQDNPYFWKNKLGDDLGHVQPEHTMLRTVPIEEYRLFRNHCKLLEDQLEHLSETTIPGTENLAIMRTIDQWAAQLKTLLTKTVKDHIYGVGDSVPTTPAPATNVPAERPVTPEGPVTPEEDPDNDRKGAEAFAKQMKERGIISEDEYQQILSLAKTNPKLALKRIEEIQKKKSTGEEVASSKQKSRDRLEALGGLIEDEAYEKIKKHIDEDELDKAEKDLAKYESENPEPATDGIDTKRAAAMEALDKAKERGFPDDKYEAYKRAIAGATDPATLDRVMADLNRTATIDDKTPPDSGGGAGEEAPPEEDPRTEEPERAGPSYSSYWDKKPNTGGRAWENLSPSEKAAWNNYGGGVQRRIAKKELKGMIIPWILRLGDPRIEIFYKRDRHHVWNELRREERIELDSDPIKDRQDFEARIERAKKLRDEYVSKLGRRGRKSDVDIEREKLSDNAGDTGDVRSDPTANPVNPVNPANPATTRTAEIPDDLLPPNLPKDDGEKKNDRTHILDDNIDAHTALEQIAKAKEDGIIDNDKMEELTDLVMNDEINKAMRKLFRLRAAKEKEDDDIDTFDWIAPQNVLREKVEYYKKLLKEGSKCVR